MMDKGRESDLKDLIYFDEDKASSLLSQIEGGLTQDLQEENEKSKDRRKIKKGDLKIIKGEFGGIETERMAQMQRKVLHHELLNRVESFLTKNNLLFDFNNSLTEKELDDELIRKKIQDKNYIRAEGFCTINDFERLQNITQNFQWLVDFINKCNEETLKKSEAYLEATNEIQSHKETLKSIKDRNERARQKKLIESREKQLNQLIDTLYNKVDAPDQWLLDGFSKWVDIFNPEQILLRLQPIDQYKDFLIISNLKREYFVENDINHVMFSYGQNPDVKITIIGLITSMPPLSKEISEEFEIQEEVENQHDRLRQFEDAVLNVFDSMEDIASYGRFVTYPNITIYPIAVFKRIKYSMSSEA